MSERSQALSIIPASAPGLAYGMGRSYGDVCLNPNGTLWHTAGMDRLLAFDPHSGVLECESGVLLRDIQRLFMPRGWTLPVTPGTQWVTVGGAIANDVHGKNHHRRGSFGHHVQRLTLLRTSGEIIDCDHNRHADWLRATVGGLGLTGLILSASLQLQRVHSGRLDAQTIPFTTLKEFLSLADESEPDWEHTVAWVDCLTAGEPRGVFMRANPAVSGSDHHQPRTTALQMPFTPPLSLINRWSVSAFNQLYFYAQARRVGPQSVPYETFLYPLDHIGHWNRIYGRRGFYQYQCVVPRTHGEDSMRALLQITARARQGSFLTVLKTFGTHTPVGMLSFPRPGVTLALDFSNQGQRTLDLLASMDNIVRAAGGAIYPAKDARMPRDLFAAGYTRCAEFQRYRDPNIRSGLARRLMDS